jgi:hypothetical protein
MVILWHGDLQEKITPHFLQFITINNVLFKKISQNKKCIHHITSTPVAGRSNNLMLSPTTSIA